MASPAPTQRGSCAESRSPNKALQLTGRSAFQSALHLELLARSGELPKAERAMEELDREIDRMCGALAVIQSELVK